MITKFNCTCGNTDSNKAVLYEGCLGYEAIICKCCGRYYDENDEHDADEFSMSFID
jgi:hypothetical protein